MTFPAPDFHRLSHASRRTRRDRGQFIASKAFLHGPSPGCRVSGLGMKHQE
jgi:hypothetical protein